MASVRKRIWIHKGIPKSAWRCAPSGDRQCDAKSLCAEFAIGTRRLAGDQSRRSGPLLIRWREAKRTDHHQGASHEIRPFLQENKVIY
jgi:hypothetical protein